MQPLNLNELKTYLAIYRVRVRKDPNTQKVRLVISNGNSLPMYVQESIKSHRDELISYYSDPCLLQEELDRIEQLLGSAEKGDKTWDLGDLYTRLFILEQLRWLNMDHPWLKVPEDAYRYPNSLRLGQPAVDGVIS